jgi:hypothetical protein
MIWIISFFKPMQFGVTNIKPTSMWQPVKANKIRWPPETMSTLFSCFGFRRGCFFYRRNILHPMSGGLGPQIFSIPGVIRYSYPPGFALSNPPDSSTNTYAWNLSLHLWPLVANFSIYPILAFYCGPYRRYRRRKKGLCLKCGYNLTGNVSGICPECGEKI